MKIRQGFVSNSSASSFIIAMNRPKFKISIEIDITNYASRKIDSSNTDEEIKEAIEHEYWDDQEHWFKLVKEQITKGKTVYMGTFYDEDGYEEATLCHNGFRNAEFDDEGAVVIFNEAGY